MVLLAEMADISGQKHSDNMIILLLRTKTLRRLEVLLLHFRMNGRRKSVFASLEAFILFNLKKTSNMLQRICKMLSMAP